MFSCTLGYGHFRPLVPLAQAFVDAGHEVVFVTSSSSSAHVEAAGFGMLPAGLDEHEATALIASYRAELLAMPPLERRPFNFSRRFAVIEAPSRLGDLRAAAASWQPDLLVHESADLAAPPVAAALGIPVANHTFGRLIPASSYEHGAAEIDALWRAVGLDGPRLGGMYDGILIDICPPRLQMEPIPQGVHVERLRPTHPADPGDSLPLSLARLPERQTVYVTLGTVFNDAAVFRVVLDGLADIDCNVIATIGRRGDLAALGPVPANAVIEPYVAQSLVLRMCAATVGHGGSGSVLAALAAALPMVLVPQGADQFDNALRCGELGAARVLLPGEVTAASVHEAAAAVLRDEPYRRSADELAQEIAALPAPAAVVETLVGAVRPDEHAQSTSSL